MVKRRVCGNKGIHDNESQKRGTAAEHAERKALGDRGTRESWGVATEHAEMSANVVFINIDWKVGRMNNTLIRNMKLLAKTIAGVVRNMNPSMICMCEVGGTEHPLSDGADATSRRPSRVCLEGCCYRGYQATKHVFQMGLHT